MTDKERTDPTRSEIIAALIKTVARGMEGHTGGTTYWEGYAEGAKVLAERLGVTRDEMWDKWNEVQE